MFLPTPRYKKQFETSGAHKRVLYTMERSIPMNEFKHLRNRMPGIIRPLAVGIPAGFLFDYIHTPIP